MTYNAIPMRADVGEQLAAPMSPSLAPSDTTTSLACYLQKGSDVTWQWGLNSNNSYYVLSGAWITTPFTGLTKFVTGVSVSELMAAATKSIGYYGHTGYTVQSLFASDGGYNYPIIASGTELYPKY
jgi:hypothetical protein